MSSAEHNTRTFARLALAGLALASIAADRPSYSYRDIAAESGVSAILAGANCHAAAWGDIDGDGKLDLFAGTFAEKKGGDGVPNQVLWNTGTVTAPRFTADSTPAIHSTGRGTGSLLVDLDNDGLLDLYVSNHSKPNGDPNSAPGRLNLLYHARPDRKWEDVSAASGAIPAGATTRNVAALDYDGDGLLDLFVVHAVSKSPGRKSVLYHNLGGMKFEDATAKAGLPTDVVGLGACVGDVNNDGWPDLFVGGSNRLFLSKTKGAYHEAVELTKRIGVATYGEDNAPSAGAAFGDIDRDGDLDLVVGHHPKRPWLEPVSIRLFRNDGPTKTEVNFVEITAEAGIAPLVMKAPHVELRDFDNDGLPDLYSAIVVFKEGKPHPTIYKNQFTPGGKVTFADTAFHLRPDFPAADDKGLGTGPFYEKLLKEKKITYMSTGPSADFDGDGKLDLFLASWFPEQPSMLLKNESTTGNAVAISVKAGPASGINRMGIGCKVRAYRTGQSGKPEALLAFEEIQTGYGYTCGQAAVAHLGIGSEKECDVVVELPYGKGQFTKAGVKPGAFVVELPAKP